MRIGVVKEIMPGETRVGMKPSDLGVLELTQQGHGLLVQNSAGVNSGFETLEYKRAGALVHASAKKVWQDSELIIKVKNPLESEFQFFREDLMLFCFLHLAANPKLLDALLESGVTAIDYGTIQLEDGSLPILSEMSKIAGEIAAWEGASLLLHHKGILLGPNANIMILGLGNAGTSAANRILPTGARFYAVDKNPQALETFKTRFFSYLPYQLWCFPYDRDQISKIIPRIDLLIGTAHTSGQLQEKLVTRAMLKTMERNSVAVDVSIDMGGCFETSLERDLMTNSQVFFENGLVRYSVPNMPALVPQESTPRLTRETFHYIAEIADKGFARAVSENLALARGVNTFDGWITHEGLAESVGRKDKYKPIHELLAAKTSATANQLKGGK